MSCLAHGEISHLSAQILAVGIFKIDETCFLDTCLHTLEVRINVPRLLLQVSLEHVQASGHLWRYRPTGQLSH